MGVVKRRCKILGKTLGTAQLLIVITAVYNCSARDAKPLCRLCLAQFSAEPYWAVAAAV